MTAEHAHGIDGGGEVEALADIIRDALTWHQWQCIGPMSHREEVADAIATLLSTRQAATRQAAADTVIAAARRICCGENPAPHHAATHDHSQRMAFAEELARAVRGS